MRLKLDHLQAKDLINPGDGQLALDPALKISIDGVELWTKKAIKNKAEYDFPDVFEFSISQADYDKEKLNMKIEAVDISTGEPIFIGKGKVTLKQCIPVVDNAVYFIIELKEKNEKTMRTGEILMRGMVFIESAQLKEQLKEAQKEIAEIKSSFEEYVTNSKSLEEEMESALESAQEKILKLSKKNTSSNETIAQILKEKESLIKEKELMTHELLNLRSEVQLKRKMEMDIEAVRKQNLDLSVHVGTLSFEKEELSKRAIQADIDMKKLHQELEDLYKVKYELELKAKDEESDLRGELKNLRRKSRNFDEVKGLDTVSSKLELVEKELHEMKALQVSKAIHVTEKYIRTPDESAARLNEIYLEKLKTLVSKQNDNSNVKIQQILNSDNLKEIRAELIKQLRINEELSSRNGELLAKIQELQPQIQVCCRIRPPSQEEIESNSMLCMEASPDGHQLFVFDRESATWESFSFNCVWSANCSQNQVIKDIEPLVKAASNGISSSIVTFGGKGSGKTFTMDGVWNDPGIRFHAISGLFLALETKKKEIPKTDPLSVIMKENGTTHEFSYFVGISFMFMKNGEKGESLFDLIAAEQNKIDYENMKPVDVRLDPVTKELITSPDLVVQDLADAGSGLGLIANIISKIKEFECKEVVHTILQLQVSVQKDKMSATERTTVTFIDLASTVGGAVMQKCTSLRALTQVLENLESNRGSDTSLFSKSILTAILRPTLVDPTNKAMIIVPLNPTDKSFDESMENLKFASKVGNIRYESGGKSQFQSRKSRMDLWNLETSLRLSKQSLTQEKEKNKLFQSNLIETKKIAEDFVNQLNERNEETVKKLKDMTIFRDQVEMDLELTQRNNFRAVKALKEQVSVNQKLLKLLKIYEKKLGNVDDMEVATAEAEKTVG